MAGPVLPLRAPNGIDDGWTNGDSTTSPSAAARAPAPRIIAQKRWSSSTTDIRTAMHGRVSSVPSLRPCAQRPASRILPASPSTTSPKPVWSRANPSNSTYSPLGTTAPSTKTQSGSSATTSPMRWSQNLSKSSENSIPEEASPCAHTLRGTTAGSLTER